MYLFCTYTIKIAIMNSIQIPRLSNINHSQADIITKTNEVMWNVDTGYSKNAKSFHTPWRVIGGSFANSVKISFSLEKPRSGKHCPVSDTGMTVNFNNIKF